MIEFDENLIWHISTAGGVLVVLAMAYILAKPINIAVLWGMLAFLWGWDIVVVLLLFEILKECRKDGLLLVKEEAREGV